jgi:hypothetical protein
MQRQPLDSSKIIQSDSFRVATTRDGSIENAASSKSSAAALCMTDGSNIPTCDASGSAQNILTNNTSSVLPPTIKVTLSGVLDLLHISNFSNASDDEAIFFYSLFFHMNAKAKVLARRGNGTCDRAYAAFMSAMKEAGVIIDQ